MTFLSHLEVRDLRNIRHAELHLSPGLNLFVGRNAQGKTSLLEAVGLLARARSFRTETTASLVREGCERLLARGTAVEQTLETALEVELHDAGRLLRVAGREVPPRAYHGRLEALVYSTERLRVICGTMRERRQYFDRAAAALRPAYRQTLRDYERTLAQRNAALESGGAGLSAWDEAFVEHGARLRTRRALYLKQVQDRLREGEGRGESYAVGVEPHGFESDEPQARAALRRELAARRRDEQRARRTLVGPHRDAITLTIDGRDAALYGSSGQARSLILALTLAALEVYRQERGTAAVALLDDLDSELDEERAAAVCREVAGRGQALVTTAHPGWARRLTALGSAFEVEQGRVRPAS